MKTRFNTFDIVCCVTELQKLVGMRVNNVYDIDSKTYLIRFQKSEEKAVLLLESGNRIHTTAFEWPKNVAPSGFSMKMRKHLKNKRLEKIAQVGTDRIINLQFGSGEAAYHVIIELYDKGNIMLTDFEMTILYVLRPHTEGDRFKFAVREKYPENRAREEGSLLSKENLLALIEKSKPGDQLKKILVSNSEYGPPLIEHVLLKEGFTNATKIGKTFSMDDLDRLLNALLEAESIFKAAITAPSKGYIIQKREERPSTNEAEEKEFFLSNQEFHPMLFEQHKACPYKEFDTFNQAVDEFFSTLESQKLELKALQQEREAMKKLENVKKDHDQRLIALTKTQELDKQKAELICRNQVLVEQAIYAIQTALASQFSWENIEELVRETAKRGVEWAQHIKELKLQMNHISLYLTDPYASEGNDDSDDSGIRNEENRGSDDSIPSMVVDIDLDLTAFANATRYYDQKRSAAKKHQKTIESHSKALKSAEKKTKQTLKEVQTITNINKARKVYWFEKFFWFISSENYLVIAGRDQQQNELIVKRYMKPTDIYVHADIHGASSVVIKNPTGQPVPPKTLNEAGTMAICYSIAWDAKVVAEAYWVWGDQVTKTAPTGEYLTTGSFMIRGKKNFLPPSHLILGLSFLFRVEDGCIERHKGERRVLTTEGEVLDDMDSEHNKEEVEVEIPDSDDEKEEDKDGKDVQETKLTDIQEEKDIDDPENTESKQTADSSDSENDSVYPDTQIKITHSANTRIEIVKDSGLNLEDTVKDDEGIVYLGDDKPVIVKSPQGSRGTSESKEKKAKNQKQNSGNANSNKESTGKQQQIKRGQKSKLKKIKEKYADQDEEERKLRMEILQSSGSAKEKKGKKSKDILAKNNQKNERRIPKQQQPKTEEGGDDGGDDDAPVVQADVDMIDTLTGIPFPEDELLFAVPVVAPYNTLSNYKFRVKLTPGTGKRGKAAKTAVAMFLKDKAITQREKDLLKAVKDELLARNLPGKVKLSAPKLQALKK